MAAIVSYTRTSAETLSVTKTLSTGDSTPISYAYATTATVVKKAGFETYTIAAAGSGDIWPDAVAALAATDVMHFKVRFLHGSTDITVANKAATITVNAEIINTWGREACFSSAAVTTVVVARAAGLEDCQIEVYWEVYTVA